MNQHEYAVVSFLHSFGIAVTLELTVVEVFSLTGSTNAVVLLAFLVFVPPFFLGSLTVRWSRRYSSRLYLSVLLGLMGVLSIGVGLLYSFDLISLWLLAVYRLLYGVLFGLYSPISTAFASEISEKGEEGDTLYKGLFSRSEGVLASFVHRSIYSKVNYRKELEGRNWSWYRRKLFSELWFLKSSENPYLRLVIWMELTKLFVGSNYVLFLAYVGEFISDDPGRYYTGIRTAGMALFVG